jgi:hypothetical protein
VKGLGLGLAIALVVAMHACGPQTPPAPPRPELITQITILWSQIRDWRLEAGMKVDPAPESLLGVRGRSVKEAAKVCPDTHPITKTCDDICSLADAICDNAEAICDIADKLGRDDHQAQEKCTSAKASCKEAKQRCCTKCSEEPPKTDPPPPSAKEQPNK